MQEEGMGVPTAVIDICVPSIQPCASVGRLALHKAKHHLHTRNRKRGHEADVYLASSLVNMYAKK